MISLADYLTEDRILIYSQPVDKARVLSELSEIISKTPAITSKSLLQKEILEREQIMSTGIGMGIGIPHIKSACADNMVMAAAVSKTPVQNYEALDGQPVHFVVMIAAPTDAHRLYLQGVAKVALNLKSEKKRLALLRAENSGQIWEILVS